MSIVSSSEVTITDLSDGVAFRSSAPANPSLGLSYLDSTTDPATLKTWNGTAWVNGTLSLQSSDQGSYSAIGTAQSTANNAQQSATNAQNTANGKSTIYAGKTQPVSAHSNDIWIKDNGDGTTTLYQYIVNTWTQMIDQSAKVAMDTANGKNHIYYQVSQPVGGITNDIWYRVNGDSTTTLMIYDGSAWKNPIDSAVQTAQDTANSMNKNYYSGSQPTGTFHTGDVWYQIVNNSDGSTGYKPYKWDGSTWAALPVSNDIVAGNISGVNFTGNNLSLSGALNVTGSISAASNGVVIDGNGIAISKGSLNLPNTVIDSNGNLTTTSANITGSINATSGTISSSVTIGGTPASTVVSNAATGVTANTAINSLQVGGTNLVDNSAFKTNWDINDSNYQNAGIYNCQSSAILTCNTTNGGFSGSATPTNAGSNAFMRIYESMDYSSFLTGNNYVFSTRNASFTNCHVVLSIGLWAANWVNRSGIGSLTDGQTVYLSGQSDVTSARLTLTVYADDQTKPFSFSIPVIKFEAGTKPSAYSLSITDQNTYANNAASTAQTNAQNFATTAANNAQTAAVTSANGYTDGLKAISVVDRGTVGSSDWNTFTAPGLYQVNNQLNANSPSGAYAYGVLVVANSNNSGAITQTYQPSGGSITQYVRSKSGGTWTSWSSAEGYADSTYGPTKSTVSTNQAIWQLASNINADGTFNTSKLNGTVSDGQIASSGTWNSANSLLNSWKSGTTLINGGMVALNTLFAQSMALGDFTNYVPNPYADPTLEQMSAAPSVPISTSGVPTGCPYGHVFTLSGRDHPLNNYQQRLIPVQPGDQFYMEATVACGTGSNTFNLYVYGFDQNKSNQNYTLVATLNPTSTWTKVSGVFTVPSGRYYISPFLQVNNGTGTTWYATAWIVRKMNAGNLIVDGSITANKIQSLNGLTVSNGSTNTFVIDGSGNVTVTGTINATNGSFSGTVTGSTISGSNVTAFGSSQGGASGTDIVYLGQSSNSPPLRIYGNSNGAETKMFGGALQFTNSGDSTIVSSNFIDLQGGSTAPGTVSDWKSNGLYFYENGSEKIVVSPQGSNPYIDLGTDLFNYFRINYNSSGQLQFMPKGTNALTIGTDGNINSMGAYNATTSNGPNLYVQSNGWFLRSTSASKYKVDIQYDVTESFADQILALNPATWYDKAEYDKLVKNTSSGQTPDTSKLNRYYGLIAEDVIAAGLPQFADYGAPDATGNREVEGLEYSRLPILLIPIIKRQRDQLVNDEQTIATLVTANNELQTKYASLESRIAALGG